MLEKKPTQHFCLQVETELEALTEVLQWFEQVVTPFLTQQGFWQCQVALAEGFTNTVRHAHKDLPKNTTIDVEVNLFSRCLEIRIWNWGQPFDLNSELQSSNPEENNLLEKEHGRGLFFMQRLTDELQYVRVSKGRNCLIMRKELEISKGHQVSKKDRRNS